MKEEGKEESRRERRGERKGEGEQGGARISKKNYITHKPQPRGRKCCSAKEG